MLTTFGYTVLTFVREKWLLLWALVFPVMLSTLFSVMFAGIERMDVFEPPTVAVVTDDAYYAAPGFAQTMEALSGGTLPAKREAPTMTGGLLAARAATEAATVDGAADINEEDVLLRGVSVDSVQKALELVTNGDVVGYIAVDDQGMPGFYFKPGTTGDVAPSVVKAALDAYVHGVAEVELVAGEKPLAMFDRSTYEAFLGQEAVITQQISVTRNDPHPTVRYYYALLGMAAGMTAQIAAVGVGRLRADVAPVGARRAVAGTPRWRLLTATLLASWACAFVCLAIAYAYMRFVLGIDFGGRDGLCLAALAVTSFMASAAGAAIGACFKETSGIITAATCILSLFVGLYGEAAMNLADRVAEVAPWLAGLNPLWQCARVFYDLLYYDTLTPFVQTCGVLVGMGLVFMALAAYKMRRQRYEHL